MSGLSAGRLVVVSRLAGRDARRHPIQTLLLLVVITAAATALTLGLVLHGVTQRPYLHTRAATSGPDVVASSVGFPTTPADPNSGLTALKNLTRAAGVAEHSGPFPVAWPTLRVHGITAQVMAEGRDPTPASVDQPKLTAGSWVRSGGIALERGFAEALDAKIGDQLTLNGQGFTVVGIAVTAAVPVYTQICFYGGCSGPPDQPRSFDTGLVWLTARAAQGLGSADNPLTYYLNLQLDDPATAPAFVAAHQPPQGNGPAALTAWQGLRDASATLISQEQKVLAPASWLLAILALASIAVVAGGRMAEQNKRVGLLKAAGSTPRLIAAVLLAQHLLVALAAAVLGLLVGWAAAPLLTSPGGSMIGQAGTVTITPATILVVTLGALAVTGLATLAPALRAARTSTIAALTDTSRNPRRRAGLIWLSTRLPVPLLLGLRLIARRPRRALLSAASFTVTATTAVAVLTFHATIARTTHTAGPFAGPPDPGNSRVSQVLLVVTVVMAVLAAANTLFTTGATITDTRRFSAVVRALGATPEQTVLALLVTQLVPALLGALLGIPVGRALYRAVQGSGPAATPSALWLLGIVLAIPLAAAALTALPARLATRRPIATTLQTRTT